MKTQATTEDNPVYNCTRTFTNLEAVHHFKRMEHRCGHKLLITIHTVMYKINFSAICTKNQAPMAVLKEKKYY